MLTHLKHNVVAYLALFVAIGGTSYAAVELPKDSVTAKQIKSGAVRSDEVKNGSLKAADFAKKTLLVGPQGPSGVTWARTNGPSVVPTNTSKLVTLSNITTPKAGRLLLFVEGTFEASQAGFDCDFGQYLEIFVDGVPVDGALKYFEAATYLSLRGVSKVVSAGPHKVQAGAVCVQFNTPTQVEETDDNARVDAILVGS